MLKPIIKSALLAGTFLISISSGGISAQEANTVNISAREREEGRITIYYGDTAAISETRTVRVEPGLTRLEIKDISPQIKSETAFLGGGLFDFLEQNFDYDLLTPATLIEKSLGQTLRVRRTNPVTGKISEQDALVLSVQDGVILQFDDGIEIFRKNSLMERLVFDGIPENLRSDPTLSTLVYVEQAYTGDVTLSYLTSGVEWKADYVGYLSADEKSLDIQGWVTLTNTSGINYENYSLQLMAGDVSMARVGALIRTFEGKSASSKAAAEFKQEELADYHLYSIPSKTTILNNQTKQVALFRFNGVEAEKKYLYFAPGRSSDQINVRVYVEFYNATEKGLGVPIPIGTMRLYTNDQEGEAQFIGEDNVPNTPPGGKIKLGIGMAFDVTVDTVLTARKREIVKRGGYRNDDEILTETFEMTVKNAKPIPITVLINEDFDYYDYGEILAESQPHETISATEVLWEIAVPANGEAKLTYTRKIWD